jgi:hypothetical protein
VFVCLILNLLSFIEYPWLFARTGATGGEIVGAMRGLYAAVVIARTLILAWVTVSLYGLLRDKEGT